MASYNGSGPNHSNMDNTDCGASRCRTLKSQISRCYIFCSKVFHCQSISSNIVIKSRMLQNSLLGNPSSLLSCGKTQQRHRGKLWNSAGTSCQFWLFSKQETKVDIYNLYLLSDSYMEWCLLWWREMWKSLQVYSWKRLYRSISAPFGGHVNYNLL